jgi:hypothetical protein
MDSTHALTPGCIEHAETGTHEPLVLPQGSFFLTLCRVAAPIPVPQPTSPGLRSYRFFFTRYRDNGQERCWLHFGHFRTAAEARKWLDVLRRIYPRAVMREVPARHAAPPARAVQRAALSESKPLSDTQVLALLEKSRTDEHRRAHDAPLAATERRSEPTLEDTLNELRNTAYDPLPADGDLSATGVRHLRVQLERKSPVSQLLKRRVAAPRARKS